MTKTVRINNTVVRVRDIQRVSISKNILYVYYYGSHDRGPQSYECTSETNAEDTFLAIMSAMASE